MFPGTPRNLLEIRISRHTSERLETEEMKLKLKGA